MKLLKKLIPLLLLLTVLSGCDNVLDSLGNPEILSFKLEAGSANPSLTSTIEGVIETGLDRGVINVTVPEAFDFANKLTPVITVSEGAVLSPGSGEARDFSINPLTYTVYDNSGNQRVYDILVKRAVPPAPSNTVFISEIFNGALSSGTTGVRVDNAYIELYNRGASDYDLSQFSLRFRHWGTTDRLNLDFTVPLTGTIGAGSTFVLYNQFIKTATLNQVAAIPAASRLSDQYLNGITAMRGSDAIELLQNGKIIDIFDPSQERDWLPDYTNMKKFVRKGAKNPSLLWNDFDWVMYPVLDDASDDDTAGGHSDSVAPEAKELTYFGFEEGFDAPALGEINQSTNSVSVIFPAETDVSALRAVFGTSGKSVTVAGKSQSNGETENNFTRAVDYTIWAENFGTRTYRVSATVLELPNVRFTTSNYDFDGNIQSVLDVITPNAANGPDVDVSSIKGAGYSGAAGTVTGVVTAKDIYGHRDAKKCFFLQDKNAGLYFFSNVGLPSYIEMGTKITIAVTTAKSYYQMPEVTVHGSSVTIVDQNIPIYYETGAYDNTASLGKVFLYEGSIGAAMDGYSVGNFTGNLYFHSDRDFEADLALGNSGKFYGPTTYSYSLHRMEISSAYQIVR